MTRMRAAFAAVAVFVLCACERSPAPLPAQETAPEPVATATAPAPPTAATLLKQPANNTALSLPGDFSAGTTVAALEQRFGKDNVRIDQVHLGEGETSRGVVLFPEDAKRRAYLYFQDEKTLRGLTLVRVTDQDTQWMLDNGLRMGMSLKDVVALNGKPIKFFGLEWDYGGGVISLNGGKLEARKDDPAARRFQFGTADQSADDAYPIGDREFSSDDPAYPRQGDLLVIREIAVAFPSGKAH